MHSDTSLWRAFAELLLTKPLIVDQPQGSSHPEYPKDIDLRDYIYLENTRSSDGSGIDVGLGSLNPVEVLDGTIVLTGILCTLDTLKCDAENRLLLECRRYSRPSRFSQRIAYALNPISSQGP